MKRTLEEVRGLSHDLRPAILEDVGLVAATQKLSTVPRGGVVWGCTACESGLHYLLVP